MSDENEIDENEEELESEEVASDEVDEEASFSSPSATSSADAAALEEASIAAREAMRKQLESDVESFLARGGKISEIAPNVVADPPRKPTSNYGGQPI